MLDTGILRKIANYSANVELVDKVQVEIRNPNKESGKAIAMVRHTVDLKCHKWKYKVFRANGNMEEFPPKYITF